MPIQGRDSGISSKESSSRVLVTKESHELEIADVHHETAELYHDLAPDRTLSIQGL